MNRQLSGLRRSKLILLLGLFFLPLAFGTGCDDPKPSPLPVVRLKLGRGVVTGSVAFNGTAPPMQVIEDAPCHDAAKPVTDESVVVSPDGKLSNVLVYLKDVAADVPLPAARPVLDQVDCRYVPHVLAVRAGQEVAVRSSDPTLHNVHYDPSHNPAANFGMTDIGHEKIVKFEHPEVGFRVKCDVHSWMTAYISVFDHPWFAVTDAKGSFSLDGLPTGTFTIVAWHERYGRLEQQITVVEELPQPLQVQFDYRAK